MGTYLFERYTGDGIGQGASSSLQDDVERALAEIDWVEHFAIHTDRSSDEMVSADVRFDEEWPDLRMGNPDLVSEVFRRLGLRTIPNPLLSAAQASADDPLSADSSADEDADGLDLFLFEE